eukprot:CAMPEP_0177731756 /NCGR_PEP_ID=MMETSP0484_2-20121128/22730_1 /TAXON_ID=354590 /ORGANISM="Rhodomonas lens, Strain RHODO" /LENGTH=95 /DNA_ID=CAMNT_0019244909 /DNA_START=89 /DNA_END=373 /DNA_ORIENTATION=+
MMRRICDSDHPPPKESAVSPSPSSWKHPVNRTVATVEMPAATAGDHRSAIASNQAAPYNPIKPPMVGNQAMPLTRNAGCISHHAGHGIRVRNKIV